MYSNVLPPEPSLNHARWAARTLFFGAGFLFATWGVHVPTVKTVYGISEAGLGGAMLAIGLGALVGLSQASRLIGRFGLQRIAWLCGGTSALAVGLILNMPGFGALLVLLGIFGLMSGVFEVAMNAEASELERHAGRPLMSGLHGMFSLGGMAGASLGSALLASGVTPVVHVASVAILNAAAMVYASTCMLPPAIQPDGHGHFVLPRGTLAVLGIMAAMGLVAEGAMYDWSVLYMNKELGSPQNVAALAYASFSAAMALTRFGGDWLRQRIAPATLLRASALLAAAAMAVALLSQHATVALLCFAVVGIGFANVVPILFSAAAQVPGVSPAQGIASVASLGYLGFMTGPPLIGLVAQHSSLTTSLFIVAGFAVILAMAAPRALRH